MTTSDMRLIQMWKESPDTLADRQVRQIIAFAGSGQLRHENNTSKEFRAFLHHVPSNFLSRYANECLTDKFLDSGFALQDIVNQAGKRLGFEVTDGRYKGVSGAIGFDGLWRLSDGHAIVVEIKTTDAFAINLETVAGYRKALVREGQIDADRSSILIVCGRNDTGDLESQVRGSRHAWDVRLISIDALLRLLHLKEELEDPNVIRRISAVLIPREFTRVDQIIDLMFSTAEEVRQEDVGEDLLEEVGPELNEEVDRTVRRTATPRFTPVKFHEECIRRIQAHLGRTLIRQTQATYASPDGETTVVCSVSREHGEPDSPTYWFAFHPHQQVVLKDTVYPFVAFGCGSASITLLIPASDFLPLLGRFHVTRKNDRSYWHVKIVKRADAWLLVGKRGVQPVDISRYLLRN